MGFLSAIFELAVLDKMLEVSGLNGDCHRHHCHRGPSLGL
jgi:hypothetical protein